MDEKTTVLKLVIDKAIVNKQEKQKELELATRPKLEDVGVQFVNNVFPFYLDKKVSSAFSIKANTARPTNVGLSPSGNAVISV